jgi:hypothetical protein
MLNPNLYAELKTDYCKRFEALVKQQMAEHQAIITRHHGEMQSLRDATKEALDKFDSLFKHLDQTLRYESTILHDRIEKLQEQIKEQSMGLTGYQELIHSLIQQMHDFSEIYARKSDAENQRKAINIQIKECENNHLHSFQQYQQEVKFVMHHLKEDLRKFKLESNTRFEDLHQQIDIKFSLSKMDKDSVLKQIRVYDKTILVIEKKLENIYTLINRMNKGEKCHKQD